MFFPLTLSLLTSCLLQFVSQCKAVPAGPPGGNGGHTITLLDPSNTNLTEPLIFNEPVNTTNVVSGSRLGSRPSENVIWPESHSGHYFIKFNDYKRQIDYGLGNALILQANNDVDDWIKVSKSGSYTPVEEPHTWELGGVRLTTKKGDYLLGDLSKYLNLMATFMRHYNECWEWNAKLIRRSTFGFLTSRGDAKLEIIGQEPSTS
ncbi:MAG: hypothetical protein Q9181_005214 [Wetmoreana brouardii]